MEDIMDTSSTSTSNDIPVGCDMHCSYDYSYVIDAVGFMAGLFVSVALVPQIRRAHQRKSAKDLSIFWQGTVVVGLTMQLFFLRYNRLWSVFIPVFGELVLILYLTGLKLHFDGVGGSQAAPPVEEAPLAQGAAINILNRGGGDGGVCTSDQPEEESGERSFVILCAGSQALEPLLGDQDEGREAEGGRSGNVR